ncbi:hypothetical protein TNCV_1892871 [Trichonephila clavipes]|nr:hypothetical protein TNCV_1892871 [Trichonephila clavipes]
MFRLGTKYHSLTSEMQRQLIVSGILRRCGRVGHSSVDTEGCRIVGRVQINPMFCRCQLKRPYLEILHCSLMNNEFRWSQKKSKRLRFGEGERQATGLPHQFHLLEYVTWRCLHTAIKD